MTVERGVSEAPAVRSLTEEILVPNKFAKIVTNKGGRGVSCFCVKQ